jgi:multisubunit Na+/H+ antiporter MnhG subunit
MTRKATATVSTRRTLRALTEAPAAMPDTTVRMTRPSTSSIIAAPIMILASSLFIWPKSDRTRAVIPTDVAVRVAPTKMAAVVRSVPELAA